MEHAPPHRIMTHLPSFRAWLLRHRSDDTPIGDLARDLWYDRQAPSGVASYEGLRTYLTDRNVDSTVLDALDRAWRAYACLYGVPLGEEWL